MNNRAATYTRVSTEEQAENGYGLEVQSELVTNYARLYNLDVRFTFTDAGISGTKGLDEREGLQEALAKAQAGEYDILILPSLDRLARQGALGLTLYDEFEKANVAIAAVKERLDTTTPAGRLMRTFFLGLAEFERDLIVERTTAGRNARGKKDGERGGRLPMGYIRGDEVVVDAYRAQMVKAMFALRDKGQSYHQIARYLNRIGFKTPRGKVWHASSVREVISNRLIYQGSLRGESAKHWPKILD